MVVMGTGFPGFVLFVWLLAKVWKSLLNGFRQSESQELRSWMVGTWLMATGFFIRIFFDDSFGGSHSYLFWILIGVALVLMQRQGTKKTRNKSFMP